MPLHSRQILSLIQEYRSVSRTYSSISRRHLSLTRRCLLLLDCVTQAGLATHRSWTLHSVHDRRVTQRQNCPLRESVPVGDTCKRHSRSREVWVQVPSPISNPTPPTEPWFLSLLVGLTKCTQVSLHSVKSKSGSECFYDVPAIHHIHSLGTRFFFKCLFLSYSVIQWRLNLSFLNIWKVDA